MRQSGCVNSPFSRHFWTFYGSSVQTTDTRLGARHRRRTPKIVGREAGGGRTVARGRGGPTTYPLCQKMGGPFCFRLGCHPETTVIEPCLLGPVVAKSLGLILWRSRPGRFSSEVSCAGHPYTGGDQRGVSIVRVLSLETFAMCS